MVSVRSQIKHQAGLLQLSEVGSVTD